MCLSDRVLVLCCLICAAPAWPADQPVTNAVIFDTSPRLTAADFGNIQQTVQFAFGTWLTTRERERLYRGVTEEWLQCDGPGRTQLIEFGAASSGLENLSPEGAAKLRESTMGAIATAASTGRPLGQALSAISLESSSLVQRDNPRITRHEAASWLEMQEVALSLALGFQVRLPDEAAGEMMRLAADQRPGDLSRADKRLATLRLGLRGASSEAVSGAVAMLRQRLEVGGASPGTDVEDPLGLWTLSAPPGWAASAQAPAGAQLLLTRQGKPGMSIALSVSEPSAPISDGSRPVSERVKEAGVRLQGSLLAPSAASRTLGASALYGKDRTWYLVTVLRAPGDAALLTVVATCPADSSRSCVSELGACLASLCFTDDVWDASPEWAAAAELRRADEAPADSGRREILTTLREAAGLLALKALGAPISAKQVPESELFAALSAPEDMPLLACPASDALWRTAP